MNNIQKQVWETITQMNRKWTVENNPQQLNEYFHKDMIAITPVNNEIVEGWESCVTWWKKFSDSTKIHFWKEIDPKVQLYGDDKFAIVTYYFEISFDMNWYTINTKWRDMFALIYENWKWLIVADHYSPFPNW